jgi:fibronectin-binding autotransporter adhesin
VSFGSGTATATANLSSINVTAPSNLGGSGPLTIDATMSGSGSITKVGGGTTTLTAANTYTGTTTVQAGTLLVNGTLQAGGGDVTVNAGGTLGGSGGAINRNVTINGGGTIRPGASPGILNVGGAVALAAAANHGFEYAGTITSAAPNTGGSAVIGTGNNHLSVTGSLTIDPGANFVLNGNGENFSTTFLPGQPYSFQIATGTTVTPFNITNPSQFSVSGFSGGFPGFAAVQWQSGFGGNANTVYFNFTPVPEPLHILLVAGVGAAGVTWYRKRRQAKAS